MSVPPSVCEHAPMEIFEDSRTVSRADLAAWLRQMAGQLESDGKVLFGAAGSVAVSDEVHCEFEIESSDDETSIEIEFTWTGAAAAGNAKASETDEEDDEEQEEEADPQSATAAVSAAEEGAADDEPASRPATGGIAPAPAWSAPASSPV